jgi:TonB family protein
MTTNSRSRATFAWLTAAVVVLAAAQRPSPVIAGIVRDMAGQPVHAVEIQVVTPTGATLKILTAADGSYEIPIKTPGQYDIRMERSGFRSQRALRFVDGRSRVQHDMVLSIGSISEELTVTGNKAVGESAPAVAIPPPPPVRRDPAQESPRPCQATAGGSDIVEPRKVADVRPIYPLDLLADGVSGTVVLKGLVTKQGTVADIKVLREAHEKLAAAASAAVAQWQFTPTRLNCVPVEVEINVTVNFVTGR